MSSGNQTPILEDNDNTASFSQESIRRLVIRFRKAIDSARDDGAFSNDQTFNRFPRACCGSASELLAKYLAEYNIHTQYVCGTYYPTDFKEGSQSHAWLQVGEVIIDITGDQFKFCPEIFSYNLPIYVGEIDQMHNLFEASYKEEAILYSQFLGVDREIQENRYKIIKLYLEADNDK